MEGVGGELALAVDCACCDHMMGMESRDDRVVAKLSYALFWYGNNFRWIRDRERVVVVLIWRCDSSATT